VKVWVINSLEGATVWSTEALAKDAARRQMIASTKAYLEEALGDQELRARWVEWLDDPTHEHPERTIFELPGIYDLRLLKGPGWWRDPVARADARLLVVNRVETEEMRIADFRDRLEKLEAGLDLSQTWGYEILEWELDTDEPQSYETWE
jgi:hypothetical protein